MAITGNRIDVDSYLEIKRESISNRIGYTSDAELSPRIASLIDEYIGHAKSLIEPSYTYTILDIQQINGSTIFIDDSITLESNIISQVLEPCTKVAVFALTIGDRLEEMTAKLGDRGLIVEAFILDAIGSSTTEKAAEFVHGIIGELADLRDLTVSRRFSPGYCDWDISQQEAIFRALNGASPGIELSDDYLMTPEKSVSGIIGIGPKDSEVNTYNPCSTCSKFTCLWRRK